MHVFYLQIPPPPHSTPPPHLRLNSDAHFRQSPVTDQLKSPKTNCPNPPQDLGPIKIWFWWSHVRLFLWCHGQACCYFPTKFKPQFSAKKTDVLTSASGPQRHHVLAEVAMCSAWSKHTMLFFFFVGCMVQPKANS